MHRVVEKVEIQKEPYGAVIKTFVCSMDHRADGGGKAIEATFLTRQTESI